MPDDKLTPADPTDLAAALAFALRHSGRKRTHNADELMSEIVAKRSVPDSWSCSARRPSAGRRSGEDLRDERAVA
jgi:hypothetical protein